MDYEKFHFCVTNLHVFYVGKWCLGRNAWSRVHIFTKSARWNVHFLIKLHILLCSLEFLTCEICKGFRNIVILRLVKNV